MLNADITLFRKREIMLDGLMKSKKFKKSSLGEKKKEVETK